MNEAMKLKLSATIAGTLLVTGCSMFGGGAEEENTAAAVPAEPERAVVATYEAGSGTESDQLADDKAEPSTPPDTIIYFNFDQAKLHEGALAALKAHASYMRKHEFGSVVLAGHADERGTREYNIALGDERSKAVKGYLVALGIDPDRLTTVSYGEEKPARTGHSERSWRENRRVELHYQAR